MTVEEAIEKLDFIINNSLIRTEENIEEEAKDKLKPCPFCGGTPRVKLYEENQYRVECSNCGTTQVFTWSSIEEAVNAWNIRVNYENLEGGEWHL